MTKKIRETNIAKITAPENISLANSPNFVVIENKLNTTTFKPDTISIILQRDGKASDKTSLDIKDISNDEVSKISPTTDINSVSTGAFYVTTSKNILCENIKKCLLAHSAVKKNYHISIDNSTATITLTAKTGESPISITPLSNPLWEITTTVGSSESDSITKNMFKPKSTTIELEIYDSKGAPSITLSKAYNGVPIWFDINKLWNNQSTHSNTFIGKEGWHDAGVATPFSFLVKRSDGVVTETFYNSGTLHALTGYKRNLDSNSLEEYTYPRKKEEQIAPLTTQIDIEGVLTHAPGQSQYFNFIFDKTKALLAKSCAIQYRMHDQLGRGIKREVDTKTQIAISKLHTVNTIKLNLDQFIDANFENNKVHTIEACLVSIEKGEVKDISTPITFNILPSWLHTVRDFAFLNSLGGWSSFNFAGKEELDFKTSSETIYKTHTPDVNISSDVESVYMKQVDEQFIVETMPLRKEVANWLRELSTSLAVYEIKSQRYVIVDELQVKTNSKDDLFTVQMKYHYADSYNGNMRG